MQILEEIQACGADIIGRQEVTPAFCRNHISKTGYPYWEFRKYSNEEEGLAVLSKSPILKYTFLETVVF